MQLRASWVDGSETREALARTWRYLSEEGAATEPLCQALPNYARDCNQVFNKSGIEWRLAERLLQEPPRDVKGVEALQLPSELLQRCSGSMLQWVLNQRLQRSGGLPGRLAMYPPLSTHQTMLFARAWAHWPENPALADPDLQRQLLAWLWPHTEALIWAAIALADAGALPLAQRCASRWLPRTAMTAPDVDRTITALLAREALAGYSAAALRRAIACTRHATELLRRLCELAFQSEHYREALDAVEVLLPQISSHPLFPKVSAMRIAALARVGSHNAALQEYQATWMGSSEPFPYPQDLLRFTYAPDREELRRHLLAHCALDETVPLWVWLEHLESLGRWQETLPQWHHLWRENPSDTYLLVGLTEALLAARGARSIPDAAIQTDVRSCWEGLISVPGWKEPAHSVLLLLEDDFESQMARYERDLSEGPLSRRLAAGCVDIRATYAYVHALTWRRRWRPLLALFARADIILLRHVCTFEEYHFFRCLSELDSIPRSPEDCEAWCQRWEELISLPLKRDQVRLVLDHFAVTSHQLRRDGHPLTVHERFEDLALQLLRRGKALGELLLQSLQGSVDEGAAWRERLDRSGLDGLSVLLDELARNGRVTL